MSTVFETKLTKEHIERSSKTKPEKALFEIVWNSLDADSFNINIIFDTSLSIDNNTPTRIVVVDDGEGIPYNNIEEELKDYGISKKTKKNKSPKGRMYHGKLGEGRYTYFSIGRNISWVTVAKVNNILEKSTIVFSDDRLNVTVDKNQELDENDKQGTAVLLENLTENAKNYFSNIEKVKEDLIKEFAPYLKGYSDIKLSINGTRIDFQSAIDCENKYEYKLNDFNYSLTIIKWKEIKSGQLFILGDGNVVYQYQKYENALKSYSLYLMSEYFDVLKLENEIELIDLKEEWRSIKDFIDKSLLSFVDNNNVKVNNDFINELKEDDVYPFDENNNGNKEIEFSKQIFDVVASSINRVTTKISTANKESRKLTYRLIRQAIENEPTNLNKILTEVFSLTDEQQKEFADLLKDISLSSMITTMKEVHSRLYFIEELSKIVYSDINKRVKERTQLQPLLENHLWIFGDQYTFGTSDISLRNVLKKYSSHLGEVTFELTEEQKNNSDYNKIPDLVLWCKQRIGQKYENLVIELKAPSVVLGFKEINQIKGYRDTIIEDSSFSKDKNQWRFILIGQSLDKHAENELKSDAGKHFPVDNSTIEIMTWGELLDNNRLRYEFYVENTKINITDKKVDESLNKKWESMFGEKII